MFSTLREYFDGNDFIETLFNDIAMSVVSFVYMKKELPTFQEYMYSWWDYIFYRKSIKND